MIIELTNLLILNDSQIRRNENNFHLIYLRNIIQQHLYLHKFMIKNIKNDLSTLSRG